MLSTRDIRRKIQSVKNIQQICRAMKTVSSVKLRKAEGRLGIIRDYEERLRAMVSAAAAGAGDSPLFRTRPVQRLALVVFTADKGLCGSYNANVFRITNRILDEAPDWRVASVGRKAVRFFRRRRVEALFELSPIPAEPLASDFRPLASALQRGFESGEWDKVDLVYTYFRSSSRQELRTTTLLPMEADPRPGDWIMEPEPAEFLRLLGPRYLSAALYRTAWEAIASEHAARVSAMSQATDNAADLLTELQLAYNKSRQAAITKELLDIVGAAEAVR